MSDPDTQTNPHQVSDPLQKRPRMSLRRAFLTGLAALLPTALTTVILVWAYLFIKTHVADRINKAIIWIIDRFDPGTEADADDIFHADNGRGLIDFDFAGFVVAFAIIFIVGLLLLTFFGRRLYARVERMIAQIPGFRSVYPHVKQLTEFLFTEQKTTAFRKVVMIEYPRRGLWSMGLVTGSSMADLRRATGHDLVSIFIPSSPTPFTGYVVAVPRCELLELPISVDEALRFSISGGVLVPPGQRGGGASGEPGRLPFPEPDDLPPPGDEH